VKKTSAFEGKVRNEGEKAQPVKGNKGKIEPSRGKGLTTATKGE